MVYTRIRCFHTQEVPYIHITTEIWRLPVACPIRLPQLCEVSSSSGICGPSSVTIYLSGCFPFIPYLILSYYLAPSGIEPRTCRHMAGSGPCYCRNHGGRTHARHKARLSRARTAQQQGQLHKGKHHNVATSIYNPIICIRSRSHKLAPNMELQHTPSS